MEAVPVVAADCVCRRLGGISVGGWIGLTAVLGLVAGALVGAAATLWYIGRVERQRRREVAVGAWRLQDEQATGRSFPALRGVPGSRRDDINVYAPMGTHKQQRTSSSELSSFGTMQFVSGVEGGAPRPHRTPPRSMSHTPSRRQPQGPPSRRGHQARHPHLPPSNGHHSLAPCPCDRELPARKSSSSQGSMEEAHPARAPAREELTQAPRQAGRTDANAGARAQRQGPNGHEAAGHIRALSAQLSPTASMADGSDLDGSVEVKLEKQYELRDLQPEWHGILAIVDKKLAEQNHQSQRADERPIVMQSLLKSSPRGGAEAAINDAVSCLLQHRMESRSEESSNGGRA